MKHSLLVLFIVNTLIFADVEVDTYIMPIRIHYCNSTAKLAWIEYNPNAFYYRNPENGKIKRPIPGRSVFFLNKLGGDDSLTISEDLYRLPDSYICLIPKRIGLKGIELIEDASSDSIKAMGIWGSRWIDQAAGKVILGKKPFFIDLIVLEQEAAYNAEHVYCFDSSFTKTQIRKLYKSGGRNNPTIKNAIKENRIIFIEEATP